MDRQAILEMDHYLSTDVAKLESALTVEAKKRGVKVPTMGALRSHVKYRQARGKLVGIEIAAE